MRNKTTVVAFLAGLALGIVVTFVVYASRARPMDAWGEVARAASPEYAMAAVETGNPSSPPEKRIAFYRYLLGEAAKHYEDSEHIIAFTCIDLSARLARKGMPTSAFMILNGATQAAKERKSSQPPKLPLRSFLSVYEQYREDGDSHAAAIDRIMELEKL